MQHQNAALVRGFDLFFSGASEKILENIAKQLGGRYSYNVKEGRATYMFEKIQCIEAEKIGEIHVLANDFGSMFAATHGCQYEYSELYVTLSKSSVLLA